MGKSTTEPSAGVNLRARTSSVVGIALLALVGVLQADAALRGRWDVVVLSRPALGLVAWVAIEVFLRPGIRLHPRGITVVNPMRTTEVPWADVAEVTTRYLVSVETRGGTRIRCWGGPTAARTRPVAAGRSSGTRETDSTGWLRASSPHRVIESYLAQYGESRASAGADPAGTTTRRLAHYVSFGVVGALVLIVVGQGVTGR